MKRTQPQTCSASQPEDETGNQPITELRGAAGPSLNLNHHLNPQILSEFSPPRLLILSALSAL